VRFERTGSNSFVGLLFGYQETSRLRTLTTLGDVSNLSQNLDICFLCLVWIISLGCSKVGFLSTKAASATTSPGCGFQSLVLTTMHKALARAADCKSVSDSLEKLKIAESPRAMPVGGNSNATTTAKEKDPAYSPGRDFIVAVCAR
jgi:hypothetical protein